MLRGERLICYGTTKQIDFERWGWRKGGYPGLGKEWTAVEEPAGEVREAAASIWIGEKARKGIQIERGEEKEAAGRNGRGRRLRTMLGFGVKAVRLGAFRRRVSERRWIRRMWTAQMVTGVDPWDVESEF